MALKKRFNRIGMIARWRRAQALASRTLQEDAIKHILKSEANGRFERRFRRIEDWLAEQGRDPERSNLAEMEQLWLRAKEEEVEL